MMCAESGPEAERGDSMKGGPDWGQLALDIHVAARTKVPVLISAPPDCAVNVARSIAAFADEWKASQIVVCNCAGGDDLGAAVASAHSVGGRRTSEVILVLQEVHALNAADQAVVAKLVAAWHAGQNTPRIISTSSESLFDRVRQGLFDGQLFYCLNTLHIVLRTIR
jgi:hypothetical protein